MVSRRIIFAATAALLALNTLMTGSGCEGGPALGSVSGTVTLDGQPLGGAAVSILAPTGAVVAGYAGPDGKYKLEGVPVGDCKFSVSLNDGDDRDLTGIGGKKLDKGAPPPPPKSKVLPRYGDPETSGLKHGVTTSPTTCDLPLKSK